MSWFGVSLLDDYYVSDSEKSEAGILELNEVEDTDEEDNHTNPQPHVSPTVSVLESGDNFTTHRCLID